MELIATCVSAYFNCGYGSDDFRIIVDGRTYAAEDFFVGLLDKGTSSDFQVAFQVPSATQRFSVSFRTSSEVTQRIDVDLSTDAVLVD